MRQENQQDRFSGRYLKYGALGFEFVVSIVFCIFIGYLVDSQWEMCPAGMLSGLAVGFIFGIYLLVKGAVLMEKEEKDSEKSDSNGNSQ